MSTIKSRTTRYSKKSFEGACLDGVASRSVMRYNQALAYCRMLNHTLRLKPSNMTFLFVDGSCDSMRQPDIRLPFPNSSFLELPNDVVRGDILLLIGLDLLHQEYLVPDNVENVLISRRDKWHLPITRRHGQIFISWGPKSIRFKKTELKRLHLQLFHPNVQKLYNLLKCARPDEVNADTRRTLEEIENSCRNCHSHRSKPYRFRVSIPEDEVKLIHELAVDLMLLKGGPLLHVVDTQKRFQNAVLLKGQPAHFVWNAFVEAWASVYIG